MPTHNYSHMPSGYSRMPDSLLARLAILCEVSEAILNDQPDALHIAHIQDIRNLAMGALSANEYEEAETRIMGAGNGESRAFGWQP